MSFEQEKMIVGSLPSLYPLQKFEEEAINALVSLPIDGDVISRKAAIKEVSRNIPVKSWKDVARVVELMKIFADRIKQLPPAQPPMPSNTSNALDALDSVNATQVNALDSISRKAAIKALDKRFDSIPMEQAKEILLLRRDLRKLPSAEPHWISCKKELPKLDSRCVLLYSDYTISGGYYRGNRTFEVDYGAEDVNTMVIAWMPRPEAWKGEVAE